MMIAALLLPFALAGDPPGRLLDIELIDDDTVKVTVEDAACLDLRCHTVAPGRQERIFTAPARKNRPPSPPPNLGVAWDRLLITGSDTIGLLKALGGPDIAGVDAKSWDLDPANLDAYRDGYLLVSEAVEFQDAGRFLVALLKQLQLKPDVAQAYFHAGAFLPTEPALSEPAPDPKLAEILLRIDQLDVDKAPAPSLGWWDWALLVLAVGIGLLLGWVGWEGRQRARALTAVDERLDVFRSTLLEVETKALSDARETLDARLSEIADLKGSELQRAREAAEVLERLLPPGEVEGDLVPRLDALRGRLDRLAQSAQSLPHDRINTLSLSLRAASERSGQLYDAVALLEAQLQRAQALEGGALAARLGHLDGQLGPGVRALQLRLDDLDGLVDTVGRLNAAPLRDRVERALSDVETVLQLDEVKRQRLGAATRGFVDGVLEATAPGVDAKAIAARVERASRAEMGLVAAEPDADLPLATELQRRLDELQLEVVRTIDAGVEGLDEAIIAAAEAARFDPAELRVRILDTLAFSDEERARLADLPVSIRANAQDLLSTLSEEIGGLASVMEELEGVLRDLGAQSEQRRTQLAEFAPTDSLEALKAKLGGFSVLTGTVDEITAAAKQSRAQLELDLPERWRAVDEAVAALSTTVEARIGDRVAEVESKRLLLERSVQAQLRSLVSAYEELPTRIDTVILEGERGVKQGLTALETRLGEGLGRMGDETERRTAQVRALIVRTRDAQLLALGAVETEARACYDRIGAAAGALPEEDAPHREALLVKVREAQQRFTAGLDALQLGLDARVTALSSALESAEASHAQRLETLTQTHSEALVALGHHQARALEDLQDKEGQHAAAIAELIQTRERAFSELDQRHRDQLDAWMGRYTDGLQRRLETQGERLAALSDQEREALQTLADELEARLKARVGDVEGALGELNQTQDALRGLLDASATHMAEALSSYQAALANLTQDLEGQMKSLLRERDEFLGEQRTALDTWQGAILAGPTAYEKHLKQAETDFQARVDHGTEASDEAQRKASEKARETLDVLSSRARLVRIDADILRKLVIKLRAQGFDHELGLVALVEASEKLTFPSKSDDEPGFHIELAEHWMRRVNALVADIANRAVRDASSSPQTSQDLQNAIASAASRVLKVLTTGRYRVLTAVPARIDPKSGQGNYELDEALYRRYPNPKHQGDLLTVRLRSRLALVITSVDGNVTLVKGRVV